jgi:hypothetical protein
MHVDPWMRRAASAKFRFEAPPLNEILIEASSFRRAVERRIGMTSQLG